MGSVYALVVGINQYEAVAPLRGCVNDVDDALEFLRARVATDLHEAALLDSSATRQAIIDGFREHLGQARSGDVALFWYSGHGSRQPVPPEWRLLEPLGFNQTLVCVDSRKNRTPDLADKELRVLLDQVAERGAHVVAVLDCCHSGGAMRDVDVVVRGVDASREAPRGEELIEELRDRGVGRDVVGDNPLGTVGYVSLAACRSFEKAKEQRIDGKIRGVFTTSLLGALKTLGLGATYRDLLTAARCKVENSASEQIPVLFPTDLGGVADQPFLGGAVTLPATSFVLRKLHNEWEVNAGRAHGIPVSGAGGYVELAVVDNAAGTAGKRVRITDVRPQRSLVTPLAWNPDPAHVYPVVLTKVPLPPATVVVGGLEGDDEGALKLVADAIATAGPNNNPSPHVRIIAVDQAAPGLRLRVSTIPPNGQAGPVYQILKGDTSPATAEVPGHSQATARIVAARLEHIAQWSHIKDLDNPVTAIPNAVSIEVVSAELGETMSPADRPALVPEGSGEIRLAYRKTPASWASPRIFIRLRNTSTRRLWCVLLDLTDRYRVHPRLFPGEFIGPGKTGVAMEGAPVKVSLPPKRPVVPGAIGTDWLKLIFADEQFDSNAFELPRLDEPRTRSAGFMPRGVVARIGARAIDRDVAEEDESTAGDWATTIVPIVAVVGEELEGEG